MYSACQTVEWVLIIHERYWLLKMKLVVATTDFYDQVSVTLRSVMFSEVRYELNKTEIKTYLGTNLVY